MRVPWEFPRRKANPWGISNEKRQLMGNFHREYKI
jgi:nitrous oxide reductase